MDSTSPAERLRRLGLAFHEIVPATQGLSVNPRRKRMRDHTPLAGQRFTVRLMDDGPPEVILKVGAEGADVQARTRGANASAGHAAINDHLQVHLADGYGWDDAVCENAGELAALLLKHMRRRLKSVAEIAPEN